MSQRLTSKENIALDLVFELLGETRENRSMDEYTAIAARLPKLAALHAYVNQRLRQMNDAGIVPFEICYFKAGDLSHSFVNFPTSLSIETVRSALHKSGMWELRELSRVATLPASTDAHL